MNKMWSIHTNECYSALKRKEIPPHAPVWMALEDVMLSETGQTQKDKQCNPTHMRSLEEPKPQRQEAGGQGQGPGAGGMGNECLTGPGSQFCKRECILGLQGGGEGCKTTGMDTRKWWNGPFCTACALSQLETTCEKYRPPPQLPR